MCTRFRELASPDSGSNWRHDARKLVRRLRRVTKLPVALGFGISTAEQFAEVGEFADAVVVGSAIVETIERNRGREAAAVGELVRKLLAVAVLAFSCCAVRNCSSGQ